jgi:hypothetical protein
VPRDKTPVNFDSICVRCTALHFARSFTNNQARLIDPGHAAHVPHFSRQIQQSDPNISRMDDHCPKGYSAPEACKHALPCALHFDRVDGLWQILGRASGRKPQIYADGCAPKAAQRSSDYFWREIRRLCSHRAEERGPALQKRAKNRASRRSQTAISNKAPGQTQSRDSLTLSTAMLRLNAGGPANKRRKGLMLPVHHGSLPLASSCPE